MVALLKEQFYQILTTELGYHVVDNPDNNKTFPCVFLRLGNVTREFIKDSFRFNIRFKIDIFSNYDGEKEILQMESDIFNAAATLYTLDGVTSMKETSFRILDDKSMGKMRKHGIIFYSILSEGGLQDETSPAAP